MKKKSLQSKKNELFLKNGIFIYKRNYMKTKKPNKKHTVKPNFIMRVLLFGAIIFTLVNVEVIGINELIETIVLGSIDRIVIPKGKEKKDKKKK